MTIVIIHSNGSRRTIDSQPDMILHELRFAHKTGSAGISVHCESPFISGLITEEREARELIAKFN